MGKFKMSDLGHRDKDDYYEALESGILPKNIKIN